MKPVRFPPGRDRLSTKPTPTGSETTANTIGIVRVSRRNAAVAGVPCARMTSGCRSSNSFADIRIRSAGGPTNVHAQVAAIGPTQLRKSLREPGEVGFCLRIVFIERHQSTDPPHAVG